MTTEPFSQKRPEYPGKSTRVSRSAPDAAAFWRVISQPALFTAPTVFRAINEKSRICLNSGIQGTLKNRM
jgi:hypothetical protein